MMRRQAKAWIATIAYKGCTELAESFASPARAQNAVVRHLRTFHLYDGPDQFAAAMEWVTERDDRFDVQIIEQTYRGSKKDQAKARPLNAVERFTHGRGFVVVTHNRSNVRDSRFEAWAYEGPLDFERATPVRFGLGADPRSAFTALEFQLGQLRPRALAKPHSRKPSRR
jgi:hypothetical protein